MARDRASSGPALESADGSRESRGARHGTCLSPCSGIPRWPALGCSCRSARQFWRSTRRGRRDRPRRRGSTRHRNGPMPQAAFPPGPSPRTEDVETRDTLLGMTGFRATQLRRRPVGRAVVPCSGADGLLPAVGFGNRLETLITLCRGMEPPSVTRQLPDAVALSQPSFPSSWWLGSAGNGRRRRRAP